MRKKFVSGILAVLMMTSGCSVIQTDIVTDDEQYQSGGEQQEAGEQGIADVASEYERMELDCIPSESVTLDVYSQLMEYNGVQTGWFADVLLKKFNVKLNYINNASDDLYDKLAATGDLGDIVIFGNDTEPYHSAINDGLLLNWEADGLLDKYGADIKANMAKAIEKNRKISDGGVYGLGHDIAYESGEFGDFDYHPDIRWDLYEQIGSPQVNEIEDYAAVLKQMKEVCPVSDSGKETYGVSLFSDWDGDMVMFVKSTCTNFFGQDEFGVGLYDVQNGTFQGCLEKDGYYIRALRFYNELYRNGLLDPESRTQGYDACLEDYRDGAAFFCIFSWMAAPQYNTVYHVADGKMMLPLAAANQNTMVYGLNENGGNRLWTIGSKTEYPELTMAVMNWLCTPEGKLTMEYGPKGITWDYDINGNTCLINYDGGEAWGSGSPQFNNTTWTSNTRNPESNGQTYNSSYWPNVIAQDSSEIEKRWKEYNGVTSVKEYLSSFNYSVCKPNTYSAGGKSEELGAMWGQVTDCIKMGSWDAIYADSETEFDKIVDEMYREAVEKGYDECVQWCVEEAAKRKAAEE